MAPESLGAQQNSGFTAGAAEFILERPTINGSIPPLAFFTPTPMSQCGHGDALYGDWNEFTLPPDTGAEPFDGDVT